MELSYVSSLLLAGLYYAWIHLSFHGSACEYESIIIRFSPWFITIEKTRLWTESVKYLLNSCHLLHLFTVNSTYICEAAVDISLYVLNIHGRLGQGAGAGLWNGNYNSKKSTLDSLQIRPSHGKQQLHSLASCHHLSPPQQQ